uniref:G130 RS Superfamily O1 precursor conopeptide n=1 Tax=Conus geographus TaxID=6491 RepID=X5IG60_CONGE|nr:G130_RS_Superfamily_O1_precursor_conopeptide [Conus geographus]
MKLTCVMIVAALFLTACQLSTAASFARDKEEYPAVRSSDGMQDSKDLTLAKKCKEQSQFCGPNHKCCTSTCTDGICPIVPVTADILY